MSFLDRYTRFPGSGSESDRSKVEIMRVKAITKANKTKKGRKNSSFMVSHLVSGVSTRTTFQDWQDVLKHVRELKSQNVPYRVYAHVKGKYSELREHPDLKKI